MLNYLYNVASIAITLYRWYIEYTCSPLMVGVLGELFSFSQINGKLKFQCGIIALASLRMTSHFCRGFFDYSHYFMISHSATEERKNPH